jgi:uncharacterized membrane protein YfcA
VTTLLVLALAAVLVGFAKTAVGGMGTVAVALYASVMPARESTAALLLLLLVGDVVAVSRYHGDCDWRLLRHLLPAVLPGLVAGAAVLALVDDTTLRRLIGAVLATLVLLQLLLRSRASSRWRPSRAAGVGAGLAAGFTTMTANAAGPVMTLYLVGQGVDKMRFLGTGAWFFLVVNLCKVPFSAGLGLFSADMVLMTVVLAPLVLLGCAVGVWTVRRISQDSFDTTVLAASALSAVLLLVA